MRSPNFKVQTLNKRYISTNSFSKINLRNREHDFFIVLIKKLGNKQFFIRYQTYHQYVIFYDKFSIADLMLYIFFIILYFYKENSSRFIFIQY